MSIDINKIAQEKIAEMEKNGEIKKHLEEKLQKLILDSVSSALSGYDVQKKIKEKIESQIAPCLDALDFTAYNSFICEKVKQITEEYLKEAMQCYHAKYGVYTVVDNYVIYFKPFAVIHMISSAD